MIEQISASQGLETFETVQEEESLFRQQLQTLRLENKFTDVIINAGDKYFSAHRMILHNSCPGMSTLLDSECTSLPNVYELDEQFIKPEIMEDLLTFFYTGKLTLTMKNAKQLYVASRYLDIPLLTNKSETFLTCRVSAINALELLVFSRKQELPSLWTKCFDYFNKNWDILCDSEQFTSLEVEDFKALILILGKLKYAYGVEEIIFRWIVEWVKYNQDQRLPLLSSLLLCVPINKISKEFINKFVLKENLITEQYPCSKFFLKVLAERISLPLKKSIIYQHKHFYVYCLGGRNKGKYTLSSISRFDSRTHEWFSCLPMLENNRNFAGTVIEKKIYLCGGCNRSEETLNSMKVYDCENEIWKELSPMPSKLKECAAAVIDNFVYVTGGIKEYYDDEVFWYARHSNQANLYRYNTQTDQWQIGSSMQLPRGGHQLVELFGRLYAIGGSNTNTVEEYTPAIDRWRFVASTKYKHHWPSAIAHYGRIYVLSQKAFEVYCPESNAWQTLTKPNDAFGQTLVSVGHKIWAIGGSLYPKAIASVFSYAPFTKEWKQLPDMDLPRVFHCSFIVKR